MKMKRLVEVYGLSEADPSKKTDSGEETDDDEFSRLLKKSVKPKSATGMGQGLPPRQSRSGGSGDKEKVSASRRSFLKGLGTGVGGAAAAYGASKLLGKGGSTKAGDGLDRTTAERVLAWNLGLTGHLVKYAWDKEEHDGHVETMKVVPRLLQKIRTGEPIEDAKELHQLWWAAEQVADPKSYEADDMSRYYAVPFPSGMGDAARKVAEWAAARGGGAED
jgi:hypothetical protein